MDRLESIRKKLKSHQLYYSAYNPRSEYLHDIEEAGDDFRWMIYEIERLKSVCSGPTRVPQDLHIHTTFSEGDGSVVPEQTVELVAGFRYAETLGISDHLDYLTPDVFPRYERLLRRHRLHIGTEVNGREWVERALEVDVDYYIYHCRNRPEDYRGAEELLAEDKPVIIAHPLVFDTDPGKLPRECLIEINNRYVWRFDWRERLKAFRSRFRFVIGSDAHQPHWLNQNIARHVAMELGIEETLLFPPSRF